MQMGMEMNLIELMNRFDDPTPHSVPLRVFRDLWSRLKIEY